MSSNTDRSTIPPDLPDDERRIAYLLGEPLSEAERSRIEDLVESDPGVRAELEELRRTIDAVKAAAPRLATMEPDRRLALLDAARRRPAERRKVLRLWISCAGLAAAAALVATSLWVEGWLPLPQRQFDEIALQNSAADPRPTGPVAAPSSGPAPSADGGWYKRGSGSAAPWGGRGEMAGGAAKPGTALYDSALNKSELNESLTGATAPGSGTGAAGAAGSIAATSPDAATRLTASEPEKPIELAMKSTSELDLHRRPGREADPALVETISTVRPSTDSASGLRGPWTLPVAPVDGPDSQLQRLLEEKRKAPAELPGGGAGSSAAEDAARSDALALQGLGAPDASRSESERLRGAAPVGAARTYGYTRGRFAAANGEPAPVSPEAEGSEPKLTPELALAETAPQPVPIEKLTQRLGDVAAEKDFRRRSRTIEDLDRSEAVLAPPVGEAGRPASVATLATGEEARTRTIREDSASSAGASGAGGGRPLARAGSEVPAGEPAAPGAPSNFALDYGAATDAPVAAGGEGPATAQPVGRDAGAETARAKLAEEQAAPVELAKELGATVDEAKLGGRAASSPASSSAPAPIDPRVAVDDILSRLDRRPSETPAMMFFRYWGDNPFVEARTDSLSTFAVDVDTASYTLLRSYLFETGQLPPPEAVRTEEVVNYFASGLEPPRDGSAFRLSSELAPSPFAHEPGYQLLEIGIKAREVDRSQRKSCSLVFVVDTSGSMRQQNRLELVKDALRLLVPQLDEGDSVGIVAFDVDSRVILQPTPASEQQRILDGIAMLQSNRNTNVDAGLRLGYEMAAAHSIRDGNNRVILLSDGVANTGVTDVDSMLERVRAQREKGILLTCVGVGMGNHNDNLMEQLADRGDGQCVYVDRLEEARKVFVDQLTRTLETVARDVKVQVAFDPEKVLRYRLLGYENRAVADAQFRDNTVDAGEIGAGHEVVALYEIKSEPAAQGRLATVRLRYLTMEHREAIEMELAVDSAAGKPSFDSASPRFRLSALAAEFAEVLRDSFWARGSSLDQVARMTESLLAPGALGTDPQVVELVALMKKADALVRLRQSQSDERVAILEQLKQNRWERALIEVAPRDAEAQRHIDELLRQQGELSQRLESILRGN